VNPTSLSLLDRLKAARPDASDWNRLQEVYLPSVFRDRFDAEPAFHLQRQKLDPFPETDR
jgi:hypothetical protein